MSLSCNEGKLIVRWTDCAPLEDEAKWRRDLEMIAPQIILAKVRLCLLGEKKAE